MNSGTGLNEIGMGVRFSLRDNFTAAANKIGAGMSRLQGITTQAVTNISDGLKRMKMGFASLAIGAVLLAPFAAATAKAQEYQRGMAKINTTAQLSQFELNKLRDSLLKLGAGSTVDIMKIPDAFEKIISQTGDTVLSLDIMKIALQGAQAGFTDLDVVAGALAQTLSIVGKENTTAAEVMDTLFAAKRVGAGEFKDFATYLPGLIAAGSNLGLQFKETAGIFAFFTAKGQDAATSTMLIQNAFSALQKTDIQKGLSKAGIAIFDAQGKMRGLTDIFKDLKAKLDTLSDQGKTKFLAGIGLRDVQARNAFAIMTSDVLKLEETIKSTTNSLGETQAALKNGMNDADKATMSMNKLKTSFVQLGNDMLPVRTFFTNLLGEIVTTFTGIMASPIGTFIKGVALAFGTLAVVIGLYNIKIGVARFLSGQAALAFTGMGLTEVGAAFATRGLAAGLRALIPAIWGAMVPLLPMILLVAGIAAGIYLAVKAYNAFTAVMEGTEQPATGFMGTLQKIGGVIQGVVAIFRSWNGETFELSKSMRDSLDKLGILDLVLNIGTWVVRIKEFLKAAIEPFISVFKTLWGVIKEVWGILGELVTGVLRMFGVELDKTSSSMDGWKRFGSIIGNFLVVPFKILTFILKPVVWLLGVVKDVVVGIIEFLQPLWDMVAGIANFFGMELFGGNELNHRVNFNAPDGNITGAEGDMTPMIINNDVASARPATNKFAPKIVVPKQDPSPITNEIYLDGEMVYKEDVNRKNLEANRDNTGSW